MHGIPTGGETLPNAMPRRSFAPSYPHVMGHRMTNPKETKLAGIRRFTSARRESNLNGLIEAAGKLFPLHGYMGVSIDDIAKEAGVTRMTFYKHFEGKYEIVSVLLDREAQRSRTAWQSIRTKDITVLEDVEQWIGGILDYYWEWPMRTTVTQMIGVEPRFQERLRMAVQAVMASLAEVLPAFALDGDRPDEAERWSEAWMVLNELMELSSMAATGQSPIAREILVRLLASRFHAFVNRPPNAPAGIGAIAGKAPRAARKRAIGARGNHRAASGSIE
jgi:AcrR family transcriptional regulator